MTPIYAATVTAHGTDPIAEVDVVTEAEALTRQAVQS